MGGGPGGLARGWEVCGERGRASGVRAACWAESHWGGPPAALRSRRLGWGGPDSFIPDLGIPSSAPSEPLPKSQPDAHRLLPSILQTGKPRRRQPTEVTPSVRGEAALTSLPASWGPSATTFRASIRRGGGGGGLGVRSKVQLEAVVRGKGELLGALIAGCEPGDPDSSRAITAVCPQANYSSSLTLVSFPVKCQP